MRHPWRLSSSRRTDRCITSWSLSIDCISTSCSSFVLAFPLMNKIHFLITKRYRQLMNLVSKSNLNTSMAAHPNSLLSTFHISQSGQPKTRKRLTFMTVTLHTFWFIPHGKGTLQDRESLFAVLHSISIDWMLLNQRLGSGEKEEPLNTYCLMIDYASCIFVQQQH